MSSTHLEDEDEQKRLLDSIPQLASFEDHKENITPRREGRSARQLEKMYQQSDPDRRQMIRQGREAFQRELDMLDELDDPLDVYVRYLHWTMDTFPQGNNQESKLADLFEKAAQRFKDDPRYRSDPRYLNCWIQYMSWTDDPKDVFVYLLRKEIGTTLALFYERYSAMFEDRQRYTEAKDALKLGIERQAQPLARLQRGLVQLEERIAYTQPASATSSSASSTHRSALGYKLDTLHPRSMHMNVFHNIRHSMPSLGPSPHRSLGSMLSLPSPSRAGLASSSSSRPHDDNSFKVLVEKDEPRVPFENVLPSLLSSHDPIVAPPPRHRQRQENAISVEPFEGATLPQRSRDHASMPTDSFAVFTDGHDEEDETLGSDAAAPPKWSRLKGYLERNRQVSASTHRTILQERFNSDRFIALMDTKQNVEFMAAIKSCMGSGQRHPISFEEIRTTMQMDRTGQPQAINGIATQKPVTTELEAIIPIDLGNHTVSHTMNQTTETLAANLLVGGLFNQRNDSEDTFDQETREQAAPRVKRQRFHNEN